MKALHSLSTILVLLSATTLPLWADILILKTSDRVTGSFDGGAACVVKFRTSYGDVKAYDALSVLQTQFTDDPKMTVHPTTSANTAFTFPAGSKITIRMIDSNGGDN